MTYEIWSAGRYGKSFGQPQDKLADDMSIDEVAQRAELGFVGHLLHNLLVVHEGETTRANKWLDDYRKKK